MSAFDVLRVYEPGECGSDGYPMAWHAIDGVEHLVRAQAQHRCVRCYHPYKRGGGEWSPCDGLCAHDGKDTRSGSAQWRILSVHHLTSEKRDCRWWNLAALCQRCHHAIQSRVWVERVYPWKHSEWFKPYAAGWYAWTILGLELTRGETINRIDNLLALERIA